MMRRAVLPVVAAVALAAVLGYVASLFLPRTYESELNLLVAEVFGEDVETPYRTAAYLSSEAFHTQLPATARALGRSVVRAEVVETGTGQDRAPAYVRVEARGRTPEEARDLAQWVLAHMRSRQKPVYEAMLAERTEYEAVLKGQLAAVRREIEAMQATLTRLLPNPQVPAPAIFLLQGQVEAKQTQLLQLTRELRDSRISAAAKTRVTQALAPPTLPLAPRWPLHLIVPLLAAVLAFLGGVGYVLLAASRATTEEDPVLPPRGAVATGEGRR
jgi:uncharacterized protein involved in exopolysaccharide biosynthesis